MYFPFFVLHLNLDFSLAKENFHDEIVAAFKPIMLLWLVIMRLQSLISVIVSLRSSESERRRCGFTPRGGKHGRGQRPLSDGRSQALQHRGTPTAANGQSDAVSSRLSDRISQLR